MTDLETELTLGPQHGELTLRTGRVGPAGAIGHDLTLLVGDWSATVRLVGAAARSVAVTARLSSLEVVAGAGGLKSLNDRDRRAIASNAQKTLAAKRYPDVVFTSSGVATDGTTTRVDGLLSVAGVSRPHSITVTTTPLSGAPGEGETVVTAESAVTQSAFRITPYSTLFGALKVADEVAVRARLVVPAITG